MSDVLGFWAAAMSLAVLALPVAHRFFRRFPDAGAGFAPALGLALVSALYFLLRVADLLPFGRGGYIGAAAIAVVIACAAAGHDRAFVPAVRRAWPAMFAMAGLFAFAFFSFVAYRSYVSYIAGTEQPMDFMYLNATLASPEYPPHDPWLAGERASYYYFGYVQVGVLTALGGAPASTGYGLGLAWTFAAGATGIASLAAALARWNLRRRRRTLVPAAAGLAVVILLGSATMGGAFEAFAAHGRANETLFEAARMEWRISCQVEDRDFCFPGPPGDRATSWYPTESFFGWAFGLTRTIPGTITEFPVFSFLLGDLHPHVTAIPLVILVTGLAVATWRGRRPLDLLVLRRRPFEAIVVALLLGALAFQNAWDVATFSGLFAAAVFARNLRVLPAGRALVGAAGYLLPLGIIAFLAYLPWLLDFSSQASGLRPYAGAGTEPAHAILLFGPVLLPSLALLALLKPRDWRAVVAVAPLTAWLVLLPLGAWVFLARRYDVLDAALDARQAHGWVTLGMYGACVLVLSSAAVALARRRSPLVPLAAVAAGGALLYFGAELLLIRDIFFGSAPRLNTVFKLTYQAWILLSAPAAVAIVLAVARRTAVPGLVAAPGVAAVLVSLVYGIMAVPNRTEGFEARTYLDGLGLLRDVDPAEYAITRWVDAHVPPGDSIVEATGRRWARNPQGELVITEASVDYTDAGRISARTGRQTPIGWYFHEIQWRGATDANGFRFTQRQDLVDRVYTAESPGAALAALAELEADYVVVGRVEQNRYPPGAMPDFDSFLDLRFESGGLKVYAVPFSRRVATS